MTNVTPNRGYRIPAAAGTDFVQPDDIRLPITAIDTDVAALLAADIALNASDATINGLITALQTAVNNINAAPAAYAGVWSAQTTQPVIGNGTLVTRYKQIGKLVFVTFNLILGTTTTIGTGAPYYVTLPVPALAGTQFGGSFVGADSGVRFYTGVPYLANANNFTIFWDTGAASAPVQWGPAAPWVPGNLDSVAGAFWYEAA